MDSMKSERQDFLLEVKGMSVTFGRLAAVSDLEFGIHAKEIFGLIGPNGAGKTTVFNAVTGTVPLSGGEIRFAGAEITRLRPHQITARGIVRAHQAATIFPQIPVREHIMTGRHCRSATTVLGALINSPFCRKEEVQGREKVRNLLTLANLEDVQGQTASNVTWAQQKRLMVVTALAAEPKLILLDEPVAGMNAEEIQEMIHLIATIRNQGITIFIIEHNMRVMMQVCDRMLVMNYGRNLAQGTPEEIARNPKVIEAYLGYEQK
jgi:branched-chain amino acid transport system ATP-binding protein